ncbi:hypothetical protein ACVINW_007746 [Bradyrhizobium sp. USDA 4461]
MKMMTAACALGAALVLCTLGTSGAEARARKAHERTRVVISTPVITPTPWDYYIVPRYRYRPEDDRVDPYAAPLVSSWDLYEGWRWPYW